MKKVQVQSLASYRLVPFMTQACIVANYFITTEEVESKTKSRRAASVPIRRTRPQFFSSDVYLAVAPKEADPE
jgi:hypothetical protein